MSTMMDDNQDIDTESPVPAMEDPGQMEGVANKGDKREDIIANDIATIQRNLKASEKLNQRLVDDIATTNKSLGSLKEQNDKLMAYINSLDAGKGNQTNSIPTQPDDFAILEKLREEKSIAIDGDDYKKALKIQDKIDGILYAKAIAPRATTIEDKKPDVEGMVNKQVSDRVAAESISIFMSEAPWADATNEQYDPMMYGAAQAVDGIVSKDPKWSNKPFVEQLREVKRRVEVKFGYGKVKGSMPIVGGVKQSTSIGEIDLTPEQIFVAKKMFPDDPDAVANYKAQYHQMKVRS